MIVSGEMPFDASIDAQPDYDGLIMLSYVILSILFLGAAYAALISPGEAFGDFSSMPVFP